MQAKVKIYKQNVCYIHKYSLLLPYSSQPNRGLAEVVFIRKTFSCVYLLSLESRKFKPKKITATKASAWYDYIPTLKKTGILLPVKECTIYHTGVG